MFDQGSWFNSNSSPGSAGGMLSLSIIALNSASSSGDFTITAASSLARFCRKLQLNIGIVRLS